MFAKPGEAGKLQGCSFLRDLCVTIVQTWRLTWHLQTCKWSNCWCCESTLQVKQAWPNDASAYEYLNCSRKQTIHCVRLHSGMGDRLRAIMYLLRLAAGSKRILLIDHVFPARLESVLEPTLVDWSMGDIVLPADIRLVTSLVAWPPCITHHQRVSQFCAHPNPCDVFQALRLQYPDRLCMRCTFSSQSMTCQMLDDMWSWFWCHRDSVLNVVWRRGDHSFMLFWVTVTFICNPTHVLTRLFMISRRRVCRATLTPSGFSEGMI